MTRTFKSLLVDIAHLLVPVLWLGLLIGVSFIATPAKFVATSLTLPIAVDVGRVTVALFNEIEWGMFALLVIAIVLSGPSPFASGATVVIGICLILQPIWLLPVMNGRIADIVAGGTPPRSSSALHRRRRSQGRRAGRHHMGPVSEAITPHDDQERRDRLVMKHHCAVVEKRWRKNETAI